MLVTKVNSRDLSQSPSPLSCCYVGPSQHHAPPHTPHRWGFRYVLSNDKRVLRLKQYSHSPVTWFRNPITHLILVSGYTAPAVTQLQQ